MIEPFRLANGIDMPALGFGTFKLDGQTCREAVAYALDVGYRHIDTADFYGNHTATGQALAHSGLPRDSVFLTTKLWYDRLQHDTVLQDTDRFLNELATPYIDLLLIHWPNPAIPMAETFEALNQLYQKNKVKAVGVSNFNSEQLAQALDFPWQPVTVNQVEFHPFLYQKRLLDFCKKRRVVLQAYCPLARGAVNADNTLCDVAQKHGATPTQAALRWLLHHGISPLPRSRSYKHIEENLASCDITLDEEDIQRIDRIKQVTRLVDPAGVRFDPL